MGADIAWHAQAFYYSIGTAKLYRRGFLHSRMGSLWRETLMNQDERLHMIGTKQGLAQGFGMSGEHSCHSIHAYVLETRCYACRTSL